MSKSYMQEIKSRILDSEDGSVFSTSDFADIADTNTVRSALYRLVKDNILRRIMEFMKNQNTVNYSMNM